MANPLNLFRKGAVGSSISLRLVMVVSSVNLFDAQLYARSHAGLPSMIVIPVGEGVEMALVSLKPAAL